MGVIKKFIIFVFVVALFLAGALFFELFHLYPTTRGPGNGEEHTVEIPPGVGPKGLAAILTESGVVANPKRFAFWVRATRQLSGIKAGNFMLKDNWAPREIIDTLTGNGIDKGIRVTIPEGFTLGDIGDTLEKNGIVSRKEFIEAATNSTVLAQFGISQKTAEGYLFPDTYYMSPSFSATTVIKVMKDTFDKNSTVLNNMEDIQQYSTLILASIVQAEAQVVEEMSTIAGVYSNRLDKNKFPLGLLQADPTVAYGCEEYVRPRAPSCAKFKGTLRRAQLDDPANLYNTYQNPGLPPGPICAPGVNALKAAASPADVPYFYFVVKKEGKHKFSVTHEEHKRAVQEYLKNN